MDAFCSPAPHRSSPDPTPHSTPSISGEECRILHTLAENGISTGITPRGSSPTACQLPQLSYLTMAFDELNEKVTQSVSNTKLRPAFKTYATTEANTALSMIVRKASIRKPRALAKSRCLHRGRRSHLAGAGIHQSMARAQRHRPGEADPVGQGLAHAVPAP